MKRLSRRLLVLLALAVTSVTAARSADALIINIDGTQNNVANPVQVFLAAGTYTVVPIGLPGGTYDAWNPFGTTTCATPSGCTQTVPTTVEGWKNSYDVISDAISAVSVSGPALIPVGAQPGGAGQIDDYWIQSGSETDRYHVDDHLVYPTAADARPGYESSTFTVTSSGLVGFSINDGFTGDNIGGMSLEVLAIPEPSTAALLALGLVSLAFRKRIRTAA